MGQAGWNRARQQVVRYMTKGINMETGEMRVNAFSIENYVPSKHQKNFGKEDE